MPLIFHLALLTPLLPTAPGTRFTKDVVLVVDVSGSMNPSIGKAVAAFGEISRQPVDDMRIRVLAFSDNPLWYREKKEVWIKLPDNDALKRIEAWLYSLQLNRTLGQNTFIIPALKKVVLLPDKHLTVVVISDMEFWGTYHQKTRTLVKKRPKWVWAAIQIRRKKLQPHAKAIGQKSGGVFYSE